MQFKNLAIFMLAAVAAADDLKETIDEFPDCALPCLAEKADSEGCKVTDFDCVCKNELKIAAKMGTCTGDYCGTLGNFDAGKNLGELCERWDEKPSSSEEAEATSALASAVSAASATATPTPEGAASRAEAGMMMVGAAAAAVVML